MIVKKYKSTVQILYLNKRNNSDSGHQRRIINDMLPKINDSFKEYNIKINEA